MTDTGNSAAEPAAGEGPAADPGAERRKWARLLRVSLPVLVLDQIAKAWILSAVPLHSGISVIPGFFNIMHVRNTGGAFSMFAQAPTAVRLLLFVGMTLAAVGVLLYMYWTTPAREKWFLSALALVLGGAAGNLADRLRFGNVVDFLDFYIGSLHWPAFNVADSAVTVGVCVLAVCMLRTGRTG
jgi:signal peptidase II